MSPRPRHVALATLVLTVATALSGAGVSSASDTGVWQSHGPNAGRVWKLAVAPSAPNILHVAAIDGGVWRSADAGGR